MMRFLQSQVVANTVPFLQKQTGTETDQLPLSHDSNPIAKHVGLIHVMRRQDDNSIVAIGSQHVPKRATRL